MDSEKCPQGVVGTTVSPLLLAEESFSDAVLSGLPSLIGGYAAVDDLLAVVLLCMMSSQSSSSSKSSISKLSVTQAAWAFLAVCVRWSFTAVLVSMLPGKERPSLPFWVLEISGHKGLLPTKDFCKWELEEGLSKRCFVGAEKSIFPGPVVKRFPVETEAEGKRGQ